ncbi:PTS transporter subunit EIIB [Vibrio agarivorans]|uniref:PTS transporter subunit EIIB n=1 Tax=Vibrio agarivorans TaxID=153622 RepID=A0ABT7XZU0_9VIBR|nr:PTS transporter subunit EIIB [Vibrio agarivorans]MDN2481291.1 PTS transporter subunit EIIB [Vibrio agarivorans]
MLIELLKQLASACKKLASDSINPSPDIERQVEAILEAIGGVENILETGACASRLRLELITTEFVDRQQLQQTGAYGVIVLDEKNVHIVYGFKANLYSQVIESRLVSLN